MKRFLLVVSLLLLGVVDVKSQQDSLRVMIGQMIMTGIGDYADIDRNTQLQQEIRDGIVGGVILFEKNIASDNSKNKLKTLTNQLQSLSTIKLLIGIDQEGGKVNRLKEKYGFEKTVSAKYLGNLDNPDSTRYYSEQTARNLNELGININFAPDLDLEVYKDNPVIAKLGRSFGESEHLVTRHARATIESHRRYNVLTTVKHFPGHGSSHSDSHLGMTDVTNYWQYKELIPYRELIREGSVDCVMSAHIVNKHLDESGLPATLSPFVINEILRETYGFDGVVFSDDMQMHAISSHYGFEQSIKLAINAGIDILMFCNNVPGNERRTATEIHAVIEELVNSGEVDRARIVSSYNRIMSLKSKK